MYLVGTRDDLWKLTLLLILALDDSLYNARVIAAQIDEDVGDAIFPQCLKKGKRCCITNVLLSTIL